MVSVKHAALRRRVYLLEAVGQGGSFLHSEEVLTTKDKNEAKQFSSRLAAKAWQETHLCDAGRWLPYPHELVAELPPPPPKPNFRVGTVEECCRIVSELHLEYCSRAEEWLGRCGVKVEPTDRPILRMTACWHLWAGVFEPTKKRVTYSLHHAMLHLGSDEDDYRTTIAHEVTHAYQRALCGPGDWKLGHGGDFYAIMRHGMREPTTTHTHSYDQSESKAASAWLQMEVERMSTEGRLAALACPVSSDKIDAFSCEVIE